jgi:hypothetical protein
MLKGGQLGFPAQFRPRKVANSKMDIHRLVDRSFLIVDRGHPRPPEPNGA